MTGIGLSHIFKANHLLLLFAYNQPDAGSEPLDPEQVRSEISVLRLVYGSSAPYAGFERR